MAKVGQAPCPESGKLADVCTDKRERLYITSKTGVWKYQSRQGQRLCWLRWWKHEQEPAYNWLKARLATSAQSVPWVHVTKTELEDSLECRQFDELMRDWQFVPAEKPADPVPEPADPGHEPPKPSKKTPFQWVTL